MQRETEHRPEEYSYPLGTYKRDAKEEARSVVYRILSDNLMIFLGVLMAPIVLLPILDPALPQSVVEVLDIADTTIIGIFILEYFLKLGLAEDPVEHFKNPWHLLDLLIITLPFLEFIPVAGTAISHSSPTLRLLRIARVAAAGGRSVERGIALPGTLKRTLPPERSAIQIQAVVNDLGNVRFGITLDDARAYLQDTSLSVWIDISGVSSLDFPELSRLLDVPVVFFESKLLKPSYPRISFIEDAWLIFVQELERTVQIRDNYRVPLLTYNGLIILFRERKIVTVSREPQRLFNIIRRGAEERVPAGISLPALILYSTLGHANDSYSQIIANMEDDLISLENIPNNEMPPDFLVVVFQLRRESSRLVSSLFHLREVMTIIAENIPLRVQQSGRKSIFDTLFDETDFLHENAENVRESLFSLISLHIDTVSYETNRAMRLIAVLSALVVIPTVVGGMLGMNLFDIPYHVHLWQIVALTTIAMLAVGWIFYKLGWLR